MGFWVLTSDFIRSYPVKKIFKILSVFSVTSVDQKEDFKGFCPRKTRKARKENRKIKGGVLDRIKADKGRINLLRLVFNISLYSVKKDFQDFVRAFRVFRGPEKMILEDS